MRSGRLPGIMLATWRISSRPSVFCAFAAIPAMANRRVVERTAIFLFIPIIINERSCRAKYLPPRHGPSLAPDALRRAASQPSRHSPHDGQHGPESIGCTLMDIREQDGNPAMIEIP